MKVKIALLLTVTMLTLLSCSKPPEEVIKNRTWIGSTYRWDDEKRLSQTMLKLSNDTLYIYSNAIFGSDNDTLTLVTHNEKDSVYHFKSLNGQRFEMKYSYEKEDSLEGFYLEGDDYYVTVIPNDLNITAESLDFYKNNSVPRQAYMYLDGTYEGTIEFEDQMMDMMLFFSAGPVKIKFVFIDDFKVKTFGSSFWGSGTEIQNYTISDNKLYLQSNDKKNTKTGPNGFLITDKGEKLVYQTDKMNMVLTKSY